MHPEHKAQWEIAFGKPIKRKKQSPANALTDAVMEYMRLLGCAVARINTTGVYDEQAGRYRFSGATKGVEDVTCTMPVFVQGHKLGVTVAVEVKIGRDTMSEAQHKRKDNVERAGGYYIVAKTFDQFKQDVDTLRGKLGAVAKDGADI